MTSLDLILLAILVVGLPTEALWKSLRPAAKAKPAMVARLAQSIRVVAVLTIFLALIWLSQGRAAAALGLDLPLSVTGMIGIATALVLLGMAATVARSARAGGGAVSEDLLPRSPREQRLFVAFALAAGIGWELLYRGYLLWALTPWLGTAGAVIVAAISYGLGHGAKGAGSLAGSVASSFLFTIAFAVSGSLWWLILLHAGLPLVLMLSARQAARATA